MFSYSQQGLLIYFETLLGRAVTTVDSLSYYGCMKGLTWNQNSWKLASLDATQLKLDLIDWSADLHRQ